LIHFSNRKLQKDSSPLPNSLIEALDVLEIECRKAIFEAMTKGSISCPRCNGSNTSAAIDRKRISNSD
jgi:hypothetical protein